MLVSKFKYAIVGAGRQGISAAYDIAINGDAEKIYIVDSDKDAVEKSINFLSSKTDFKNFVPVIASANDKPKLSRIFSDVDAVVSAVPYYFNIELTKLAIENNASFCDMGGNTPIVREQLKFDEDAKRYGVAVVPDTGMGPGLNITMIRYAFDQFDEAEEIFSYVGGLPLNPKPPFNYELIFNINGLTNEYYGNAFAVKNGMVVEVPCLTEVEEIEFEKLGTLEAAVTTGGLSTAPWYFADKLKTLEYKTLRYPGHWEIFRAYSLLGLFSEEPVNVKGVEIVPRDVYHTLLEPKLKVQNPKDVGIMRIVARGIKDGKRQEFTSELVEKIDEEKQLTAMQKLTGWHSSIVAILSAKGEIPAGAHSVETLDASRILDEAKKRGFVFRESRKPLD